MTDDRHTPWLEWNADQLAYDQALREGPTAAIDRFCTLYSHRASVPLTSAKDDLVSIAEVLSEQIEWTITTNEELWRASIDSEFILFLINAIAEAHFFDHHPDFAIHIGRSLYCMLTNWMDYVIFRVKRPSENAKQKRERVLTFGITDAFWAAIGAMWASLWSRRSVLARRLDVPEWRATALALDMIASLHDSLCQRLRPHISPHPVVVQVAYFSWVYLHGSERINEREVAQMPSQHNAPRLLFEYYALLHKADDGSSAMPPSHAFLEQLVNNLDARTLVRAAVNALTYSQSMVDDRLLAYTDVLAIQMRLIGVRWYASGPLFEALYVALLRQEQEGRALEGTILDLGYGVCCRRNLIIYAAALEHTRTMINGVQSGSIPLTSFSGHIFWDILRRGVPCSFEADKLLRHQQGICACGSHEALVRDLSAFLGTVSSLLDPLASGIRNGHLSNSLISSLREAGLRPRELEVTGAWYHTMVLLRQFVRSEPSRTTYTALLDTWSKLGDAFGYDEASQRDLEAARRAHLCSWHLCVYYSKPSQKTLLVCKGCKEARYCSAACQRSDWKQGGHRSDCRRLK